MVFRGMLGRLENQIELFNEQNSRTFQFRKDVLRYSGGNSCRGVKARVLYVVNYIVLKMLVSFPKKAHQSFECRERTAEKPWNKDKAESLLYSTEDGCPGVLFSNSACNSVVSG